MKLTKGIISRDKAQELASDYVAFIERDYAKLDILLDTFGQLRRGQKVVTFVGDQYVMAKVSSIDHNSWRAIDGPVVRVSNGEFSWRVDGSHYAWPVRSKQ